MASLITGLCILMLGAGVIPGQDADPTFHFEGSIARSTANSVVITVYDQYDNVVCSWGPGTPGQMYSMSGGTHISFMPFHMVCTRDFGGGLASIVIVKNITGDDFYKPSELQWYYYHNF